MRSLRSLDPCPYHQGASEELGMTLERRLFFEPRTTLRVYICLKIKILKFDLIKN